MLYLLLIGSVVILILNYFVIAKKDYMNPSIIFCLVFIMSELLCIIGQEHYAIEFYPRTVLVVLTGLISFSAVAFFIFFKKDKVSTTELEEIKIPNCIAVLLILLELAVAFMFYKYLINISISYDSKYRSLSEMIDLYNKMSNFFRWMYTNNAVSIPFFYRIGEPVCGAAAYIALYVVIHNFICSRKINILHCLCVVLYMAIILLNGSRSPIFRMITYAVCIFMLLGYRSGKIEKGSIIILGLIIVGGIIFVVSSVAILFVIRPNAVENLFEYIFTYIGAPLLNLNNILDKFVWSKPEFFGKQTFISFYHYFGKLTNNPLFSGYASANEFTKSLNDIETGNVYTYLYKIIFDFNYNGIIPFTGIMALYYCFAYMNIQRKAWKHFDLHLHFYAYLFNDIIMSMFSSRFYETVGGPPFIKWALLSILLYFVVIRKKSVLNHFYAKINQKGGLSA